MRTHPMSELCPMSDLKSDWKRWSRAERVSAIAIVAAAVIACGSATIGGLTGGSGGRQRSYPEHLPKGAALTAPIAFTSKASIPGTDSSGTTAGPVGGCLALAQARGSIRTPSSTGAMLMTFKLIANSLSERAFKALGIEEIAY